MEPIPKVNQEVAHLFEETAHLLEDQRANPHRIRAYQQAASYIGKLEKSVSAIHEETGVAGLEQLPFVGESLAQSIRDIVLHGTFRTLERLRGQADHENLLTKVSGVGPELARRLHDMLGIETLEQLEYAAHTGQLDSLPGFGPRRIDAIKAYLSARLVRYRPPAERTSRMPPVDELLDIDGEYRASAKAGKLQLIAPKRFNPAGEAWLPILHTERGVRHYTVLFSNTARAHKFAKTHDWVVIYLDNEEGGQWTVVTASKGSLAGHRVVRGREEECIEFYGPFGARTGSTMGAKA